MKYIQIIALFVLMASCSRTNNETKETTMEAGLVESTPAMGKMAMVASASDVAMPASDAISRSEEQVSISQPKIIKEAYLMLKVENYKEQKSTINQVVRKYKGYISSENEQNTNERIENTFSIRVDAGALDSFIEEIEKLALKIESKSINSQDVTEEYIDVEARINTKKIYEQKYFELLKQTHKVSEIIELQNQLKILREEIESMEGRMRYMNSKIAMSTLNLTIYQTYDFKYEVQGNGFWFKLKSSFASGWDSIQNTFFFFIANWNWWAILLFIYFLYRIKRNK